jgi:hypothetical protein
MLDMINLPIALTWSFHNVYIYENIIVQQKYINVNYQLKMHKTLQEYVVLGLIENLIKDLYMYIYKCVCDPLFLLFL